MPCSWRIPLGNGHKYVNLHRHQLLIFNKINNGWSLAVTVLQRIASTQQIGLLLVPAIKGVVYINTHCNYSQPELTKLYNENIGGHPYTFTVGSSDRSESPSPLDTGLVRHHCNSQRATRQTNVRVWPPISTRPQRQRIAYDFFTARC